MHSESALVQAQAIALFTRLGNQDNLNFALRHKAIIDRFGRYPRRNAILGRASSAEELAFLSEPGFFLGVHLAIATVLVAAPALSTA